MGVQLFNLLNSSIFQVVAVIWFIILIIWREKWVAVLERTIKLIRKPIIFRKDSQPDNVPTYPREFFEDSANSFRYALTKPLSSVTDTLHRWLGNMMKLLYDPEHPFRTVGYIVLLICFLLLIYSDAVAVANTLFVLGLLSEILPFLSNFDIAIFAGSLIALILGFAFLFETMSGKSEFTAMSEREPRVRKAMFAMAAFICLLSITSLVAWGLARLDVVENLNSTFLDRFVTFVVVFVVPFNSALAAAMIFNEAIRGSVLVFAVVGYIVEGVLHVVNFILTLLSSLLPFVFDVLYRLIHVLIDIIVWIITTPILAVFWPFMTLIKMITDNAPEESTTKHKPEEIKQRSK